LHHDVLEGIGLASIVACDHAALDGPAATVGSGEPSVERRAADAIPEDVDRLAEVCEGLGGVGLLVVKGRVDAKGLDELDLLVGTGRGDDVAARGLGDLADELCKGKRAETRGQPRPVCRGTSLEQATDVRRGRRQS
jgi:hypothetical protein